MNAAAQSLVSLLTAANTRFVIPVYQRPYSWDEKQCIQLWEDVLSVGKRPADTHFTGSVVYMQDGTLSAGGVTPLLLIDGQQRITTLTLLLAALADFSRDHPERQMRFSHAEIMGAGYLTHAFKQGNDHYNLTLSQGDRTVLKSLVDYLEDSDSKLSEEDSRIFKNFELFRQRIEMIDDPNIVWDGVQRLVVVGISLDVGKDNPQLIFESMNSTGKDLSSADLIRNYVLMGLPREEQDRLYRNHWRVIEETLGAGNYDEAFDEFVRDYLTVLYAPEPLARRDVYPLFKRHVVENGYDKNGRITELLCQIESFARYYACINSGAEKNAKLKASLDDLSRLKVTVVNPLLMSFYEDYEAGAFETDDFVTLVRIVESYLFRRAVCDAATNSLQKFFSSVIAKMNRVQEEGGNYLEAFESYLLLEAGTARRFPTDAEFSQALKTRDVYHFRRCFYLLENLENVHHPKNPVKIDAGSYTIEHVMPQNALAHDEWRASLGQQEEAFDSLVNALGNLTLTSYNSELSDGTFEEKKSRLVGGYDQEWLVISRPIRDASEWTPTRIEKRSAALADSALVRWPFFEVEKDVVSKYDAKPDKNPQRRSKGTFKRVFEAGFIAPGTQLFAKQGKHNSVAVVDEGGRIALSNGETFNSPSHAARRVVALDGGAGARNGWKFWKVGADGPELDLLRQRYFSELEMRNDLEVKRMLFWDGFYEYCLDVPGFTDVFGDVSERPRCTWHYVDFGIGLSCCHLCVLLGLRDGYVGVQLYFKSREGYEPFFSKRSEVEASFGEHEDEVDWNALDMEKRTRSLTVRHRVNFDADDQQGMYESMVGWMLTLRRAARRVMGSE